MKKLFSRNATGSLLIIFILTFSFFVPNLLRGKLPIPGDNLLGLYHPFRDAAFDGYASYKFPAKNPLITDPVLQTYPWRFLAVKNLKSLKIPYWNPYSFSGQPLAGNIQSAPFYVFNLLFFIMPFNYAWTIQIIMSTILTALFMYLFLKSQKIDGANLSNIAAIFGGVTLAFSGFYTAWLEWNTIVSCALWLPLILLSINKYFENGKAKWFLLLCFSLAQTVFAGHAQTALYVYTASLLYLTFVFFGLKNTKRLFILILAFLLSFLVVLPQVIPAVEFINHSARAIDQGFYPNREDWFIPLQNLVQVIAPDYFGNPATYNYWGIWNYGEFVSFVGLPVIYLSTLALFQKKVKAYLFFILLLVSSLLLSIKNPLSILPYTLNLPFIATLQPSRIIFLIDFTLCALGAFGLHLFLTRKENLKRNLIALALLAFLLALAIFTYLENNRFPINANLDTRGIALRNLLVPIVSSGIVAIIVFFSTIKKKKNIFGILLLVLAITELFRFSNKFLSFTKENLIYPKTEIINTLKAERAPFRIITTDRRIMHPNISGVYGIESVDGFDPLYLKSYGQFVSSWQGNKFTDKSNSFNRIITPNKIDSPILNLLNTKYILSFDNLESAGLEKIKQEGETILYENRQALPRLYFVNNIIKTTPDEEFNKLLEKDFILKNATSQEIEFSSTENTTSVEIQNYEDDYLSSLINTKVAKPLILSNIYYPGWKAYIDKKETQIYKVDSTLQAIIVPEGTHIVEFKYINKNSVAALLGSIFGILSIVLVSFYLWLKKSRS